MHTYLEKSRPYSQFLDLNLTQNRLQFDWLETHLNQAISKETFQQFAPWQTFFSDQDEVGFKKALRQLRLHVVTHIICRDLCHVSTLSEVTQTITNLAEFAIEQSLPFAQHIYQQRYGEPIGAYTTEPQSLTVIAMGKMGGNELNVSSDIDLIFTYPESGQTNGKRSIDNQDFFIKVGKKLIQLIDDITEDGQVFRVDMRLRPNGDSGALAISESALEQYLITQGREWERYAWLKARVISVGKNGIASLVKPFVYRKYLDFSTYEGLRDLHQQIRHEVLKKEKFDNIKLGAGGIREIEFITQVFQLIRGGQLPVLQRKDTQGTLSLLGQLNIIPPQSSQELLTAYHFLRDCEHRLQYWNDQQTQTLPTETQQQKILAQSMGFENYAAFYQGLNQHRHLVNDFFNQILTLPEENQAQAEHPLLVIWQDFPHIKPESTHLFEQYGFEENLLTRLSLIHASPKYQALSDQAQKRFTQLLPLIFDLCQVEKNANDAFRRSLDFLETISRRTAYLALLIEQPKALTQLIRILASSQWMADYLNRHPILIDELLSNSLFDTNHDWLTLKNNINQKLHSFNSDIEGKMDALRHFQHALIFRLAVQDLRGLWAVEALSDELSALADCIIAMAIEHAWLSIKKAHQAQPDFAVIGYGRLGGKELGYASDLDLVYVYQDSHPDAINNYTRLAQRLTSWLSTTTAAGNLYQVDLRLRPDGDAGFVCTEFSAFSRYQQEKAWTWEHQALTRARFIAGSDKIGQQFDQLRSDILCQQRNLTTLKNDILDMRTKMENTHPADIHKVKYARGGVVDIEFMVQYLILGYAHQHKALTQNHGNIALVNIAAEYGLFDKNWVPEIQEAYRYYRSIQHQALVNQNITIEESPKLQSYYQQVSQIWLKVFA